MALNPPLLSNQVPVGLVGEIFCLSRTGVSLEAVTEYGAVNVRGTLVLTTLRLCFMATTPQNGFHALDVPLIGLQAEKFVSLRPPD